MTAQIPPCKFCEKKGLPILPMRFGIAPTKSFDVYKFRTAPPDATQLLEKPEVAINAADTLYTGRMLRAGYLYIYYQTHNQWEAYAVDSQGCLSNVSLTDDMPPGGDRFHAACARDAVKVANASVLTIEDPETAGTIWVGFSDAWWTKAIRDKNAGLSDIERAVFMRKVDIDSWYNDGNPGGSMPKHAFQMYQVDMLMAEYAMPITDGAVAFAWATPAGFDPFTARPADTLKKACDALVQAKGLVLELPDPVGIAQELPAYMSARWQGFTRPYTRQLRVDSDLSNLEKIVKRQAQDNLVGKFDFNQNGVESLGDAALREIKEGLRSLFGHDEIAVPRRLTSESIKTYKDAVWNEYQAVIDQPKREGFKSQFDQKSGVYNKQYMEPLAKAHAAWMKSEHIKAAFEHHYDPEDINTGVGFLTVLTACVLGTGGYGACQKVYGDWLKDGLKSTLADTNILWRALVYNHPTLLAKVAATGSSIATPTGVAEKRESGVDLNNSNTWTTLFAGFEAVASKLHMAGETASRDLRLQGSDLRALTAELGAPMATLLKSRVPEADDLLAAMGMHAGAPARFVTTYGTHDQVARTIFDTLEELQPSASQGVRHAKMFSLYHRMRIFDAELVAAGINPYEDKVQSWGILLDTDAANSASLEGLSAEAQAANAAAHVKVMTPLPSDGVIEIDNYATRLVGGLKTQGAIASVSAIFAVVGLNAALDAEHKALAGEKVAAETMVASAVVGIIGSAFDMTRVGIKVAATREIPFLGPIARKVTPRFLKFTEAGGAAAGSIAMLIAATVDFRSGVEVIGYNEPGVSILFFSRAVVEGGVGIQLGLDLLAVIVPELSFAILSGPAVWVAIAAIAIVSIVIDIVKDPETLVWARECYFGKSPEEDYSNDDHLEQKDYMRALAG